MAKRKERVAPPPSKDGWDFRFATNDAVKGWEQICSAAAANARVAWERITAEPRRVDSRQHRLRGSLGNRAVNGVEMEQWQYEVTARVVAHATLTVDPVAAASLGAELAPFVGSVLTADQLAAFSIMSVVSLCPELDDT